MYKYTFLHLELFFFTLHLLKKLSGNEPYMHTNIIDICSF